MAKSSERRLTRGELLRARLFARLNPRLQKSAKAAFSTLKPLPGNRLSVQHADGVQGIHDVTELLDEPVFGQLCDPKVFAKITLSRSGAPTWPDEMDITGDPLYEDVRGLSDEQKFLRLRDKIEAGKRSIAEGRDTFLEDTAAYKLFKARMGGKLGPEERLDEEISKIVDRLYDSADLTLPQVGGNKAPASRSQIEQRKRAAVEAGLKEMRERKGIPDERADEVIRRKDAEGSGRRRKKRRAPRAQSRNRAEPPAQARERLVTDLLANGWTVKTYRARGQRPLPELTHRDRAYTLSFYGHTVQQSGMVMLLDCRGWTTAKLLEFCDRHPTAVERRDYIIKKGLADVKAGVPGLPHKVVMAEIDKLIEIWFDKDRKRPPTIPVFKTEAQERVFWKTHSVLDYFAERDILEGTQRKKGSKRSLEDVIDREIDLGDAETAAGRGVPHKQAVARMRKMIRPGKASKRRTGDAS